MLIFVLQIGQNNGIDVLQVHIFKVSHEVTLHFLFPSLKKKERRRRRRRRKKKEKRRRKGEKKKKKKKEKKLYS